MCLNVYLGTSRPITIANTTRGHLGIEKASWTPPPLKENYEYIYRLGTKGNGPTLCCSCMLMEYVDWTDAGTTIRSDQSFPDDGPCPFDTLRVLCDEATQGGGFATIVCDDIGSEEPDISADEYGTGCLVRLHTIARGNLLFADVHGSFPWRVLHIVR